MIAPLSHTSAVADRGTMRAMLTLAALVLAWCACSLAVFMFAAPSGRTDAALLPELMTAGFILLAARGGLTYLRRVEPCLARRRTLRAALILGCLAVGGGLVLLVRGGLLAPVPAFVIGSANLLVFAALLGSWLVVALKRPAELVTVCAVMATADLLSLLAGPTREVVSQLEAYYRGGMEGPVPLAKFLLVQVPVPGLDRLLPLFGVADWIMVAFLVAAMHRFDLEDDLAAWLPGGKDGRRIIYLPVPVLGLLGAVLLAQGLGVFLPALPVVGAVFVAFLLGRFPCARRLQRIDLNVLVLVTALCALAVARGLELF